MSLWYRALAYRKPDISSPSRMSDKTDEVLTNSKHDKPRSIPWYKVVLDQGVVTPEILTWKYEGSGTEEDHYVVHWIDDDPRDRKISNVKNVVIQRPSDTVYFSNAPAAMEEMVVDHDTLNLDLGRRVRLQRVYWRHLKDHSAVQGEHHSRDARSQSLCPWFCRRSAALGAPERNLRAASHVCHDLWGPYGLQRWMCWGPKHGNVDRTSFFRRYDRIFAAHCRSNDGTACLY